MSITYNSVGTSTASTASIGNYVHWYTGSSAPLTSTASTYHDDTNTIEVIERHNIRFPSGVAFKKINSLEGEVEFPDGSILKINKDGSFKIDDKDSKVIYKANNIREFNRYINASDLLEEFIRFLGEEFNIRQNQIMDVPINVFIEWLIVQAAIKDGDEYENDKMLLESGVQKKCNWYRRCKCCGRYIQKKMYEAGLSFCNSVCFDKYALKMQ